MNEDKAARYQRLKRRASIVSLVWSVALLTVLVATGRSVSLRTLAERAASASAGTSWVPAVSVAFEVALLAAINELGSLPIAFYSGFLVEQRYELSKERVGGWAIDRLKSFTVATLLAIGAASLLYFIIRLHPGRWWLPAGAVFALLIVGVAKLGPVLLLPLFYRVKPLAHDALRRRLVSLAERAGAPVLGAYEWGLSTKTRQANAALAGLGSTRRILVSDTMLSEYSDEEIEVVLAHELAHHVHRDIWKGLAFESALVLAGFYFAARMLGWSSIGPAELRGPSDPAGLPVLLLALSAVSLVMAPVAHALSRAYERSADRFALEVTGNPRAFVSAMRRLAEQNLAEEHPSRFVLWLFYGHPPIRDRIAAAESFAAR